MNSTNFIQRLNETISWCSLQEINNAPEEDESVKQRRLLNQQGVDLFQKGFMMAATHEHAGWFSRRRAKEKIRLAAELRHRGQELMKTAAVTSIAPPLRHQLRSEALRPLAQSLAQSGADHTAIVEQVAEARSQILRDSGVYSESQSSEPRTARLLLYAPQDNLACGTAEYLSLGFFDVDNVSPWDTWILMLGKYLVSWVPPQLVRLVQEGLDVNPEQCILWANDSLVSREPIATTLGELLTRVA
jgi:hypothetical protein